MLAEFSLIPLGKGEGVSDLVAKALDIVNQSGLDYRINPMTTVLEGDWDRVMEVIRTCHMALREDASRVITSITIDDRDDFEKRIDKKVESIEKRLGYSLNK